MATKNKKTKKSSKNNNTGSVLIVLLVFVLAAVIVFGTLAIRDQMKEKDSTENVSSDINTAPLYTEDNDSDSNDGTAVYDEKDAYDASQNDTEVEKAPNGLKIANTILSINQNDKMIIFSARVTNFLETGGKCSYILTKGTEMVTYTKDVLPDPKTTVCESLVLEKSSLSAGEWQIKVEYKSEDAEGASETQSFKM